MSLHQGNTHTQKLANMEFKFRCVSNQFRMFTLLNESQCLEMCSVAPSGGQLANNFFSLNEFSTFIMNL